MTTDTTAPRLSRAMPGTPPAAPVRMVHLAPRLTPGLGKDTELVRAVLDQAQAIDQR